MFGSQQAIINLSFFSILPVILILFFVYKRDKFPEPPRVVFITLLLGFGITLPISLLIPIAEGFIENIKCGNVYVNRNMIGAVVGVQPFGGQGLSGTGPKAGGPNYVRRLLHEKAVSRDITASGGNASLMLLED